jgi:U3 small nucleolar RNA-associated protein 3
MYGACLASSISTRSPPSTSFGFCDKIFTQQKKLLTMGKRRQTAKTGDKALYKGRPNESVADASNNSDDDTMYDAVDRFHNRQDFLKLDATGSSTDESEDDGISNRQGIMNIDSSSGDDDSDDDDSAEEQLVAKKREEKDQVSQDEDSSSDSDDDEMLEMEQSDVRDWGSKKSAYYHGDTADLEIGQDAGDAFLEEEAAKEVQAARYEQMDEDDFVMSDDDKEEIKSDRIEANEKPIDMRSARDLSKLSKSDRRRLLESLHPEVLPLVSHFRQSIEELDSRTSVAVKAVLEGDKGTIEVRFTVDCINLFHANASKMIGRNRVAKCLI